MYADCPSYHSSPIQTGTTLSGQTFLRVSKKEPLEWEIFPNCLEIFPILEALFETYIAYLKAVFNSLKILICRVPQVQLSFYWKDNEHFV